MRITNEYTVRVYGTNLEGKSYYDEKGSFNSLEEAHKHLEHENQVTWEDLEEMNPCPRYSVIWHFRDDEHYNDLYFI